jgi:hypothetical protein
MLFLVACAGSSLFEPPCDRIPEPGAVRACFGGDPVAYEGYGTVELTFDGTVTSMSEDASACELEVGTIDADEPVIALLVEDDAGATVTVGLQLAALGQPIAEGDAVSLDLAYTFGEFGPDVGHVIVSRDDAPIVGVSVAGSLDDLVLPEGLALTEGERLCTTDDGCGVWAKYDLEASFGGETAALPYGEDVVVGGLHVAHGGYEQADAADGGECPDWFVAHVDVGFSVE